MGLNKNGLNYLIDTFKRTYVIQIDGLGLSTEDYTTDEKNILSSLNTLIGSEELQTTAKTITGAVNEILGASIDGHLLSNITDDNGVHSIRYNSNLLQINQDGVWGNIPYLTSDIDSVLNAKITLGEGSVVVDSTTGEILSSNEYYIDSNGNGSFASLTRDGNIVLDASNYTSYCATKDHTHNYAGSSSVGGSATSANKVNTNLVIKLNSGTTEGTNMFTFNGSTAKTINITASSIGASASSHTHSYLPLSGGTLTGALTVNSNISSTGHIYLNNNRYYCVKNTSGTALGVLYANTSNSLIVGTTSLATYYYSNDNHVFNGSVHLSTGNIASLKTYSSEAFSIYSKWKDGSNHDIVVRGVDGLGCAVGWVGSASYATIMTIRGRTCKYANSAGTTTLSDRNLKKDFTEFSDAYDIFYDNLKPKTYKYILGSSGRPHSGYVTQEVEEALEIAGLTTNDFAGVNIMPINCRETESDGKNGQKDIEDSADNYLLDKGIQEQHNLVYTEFVALNTWQIQKLKNKVKEQEEKITELNSLVQQLLN